MTAGDVDGGETQHWYPWFLPDGRRFLINVPVDDPVPVPVTLVVNWPRLLAGR